MSRNRTERYHSRAGSGGRREDLGGLYVRSRWEANWARYLNFLCAQGQIVRWEYEADTFAFPIKRGSTHYTPDFKIINRDGSIEYHEVKGWMDPKSRTKLARMTRHFPDIKIVLIDKTAYTSVARKMRPLIPAWEWNRNHAN